MPEPHYCPHCNSTPSSDHHALQADLMFVQEALYHACFQILASQSDVEPPEQEVQKLYHQFLDDA